MRTIRSTESISLSFIQRTLYCLQIGFRQDTVRIQDQQIFAFTDTRSIITRPAGSAIRYHKITDLQFLLITLYYCLTRYRRAILNNKDLKIRIGLQSQTIQQIIHFVRTIIDRDYNRVVTHILPFLMSQMYIFIGKSERS